MRCFKSRIKFRLDRTAFHLHRHEYKIPTLLYFTVLFISNRHCVNVWAAYIYVNMFISNLKTLLYVVVLYCAQYDLLGGDNFATFFQFLLRFEQFSLSMELNCETVSIARICFLNALFTCLCIILLVFVWRAPVAPLWQYLFRKHRTKVFVY